MRQPRPPARPTPSRSSALHGFFGLLLGLFLSAHLLLLIGLLFRIDALKHGLQAIGDYGLLDKPPPALLSLVAAGVTGLLVSQAWLALRRLARRQHRIAFDGLNWLQAGSCIAVFLFTGDYLLDLLDPPLAGATTNGIWPVCIALLFALEVHAGVLLYRRLARQPRFAPQRLRQAFASFFVALGLGTLVACAGIGELTAKPLQAKALKHLQANAAHHARLHP